METQNPDMPTPKVLSNEMKLKINGELKFLQDYLVRVEKAAIQKSTEQFFQSLIQTAGWYSELRKNGSPPERAQAVLMMGLRKEIERMYTAGELDERSFDFFDGPNDSKGSDTTKTGVDSTN